MNELQKTQHDILKEFIRICDELNIVYYLVCGSALGAVKYQGFIPWDDDVDVALLRPDYEKFLQEAPKHLPKHLFLQNYISDPQYPITFSKIRNSETTYVEKSAGKLDINHGIYIDIFPIDGYPQSKRLQQKLEFHKKVFSIAQSCVFQGKYRFMTKVAQLLYKIAGVHRRLPKIVLKHIERLSSYNVYESDVWCNHGNWQGKLEYAPKWHYGEGTWAMFEGLKVRIPENYDAYLTQKYGNWRAELPKEQQVGHHYYDVMDLKRPYTYYFEKNQN